MYSRLAPPGSGRHFAGAAYELHAAVIANPYDPDAVAEALQTALGMSLEERRERWRAMMAVLRRNSIMAWRESFLELSAAIHNAPLNKRRRRPRNAKRQQLENIDIAQCWSGTASAK